jgi:biopolymer transport protein ExbD
MKMKLSKGRRHNLLTFNLTPMVDVVFLLIIFFMTVSQISKINSQFLQIPEVGRLETEETPISITINLLDSGAYLLEGTPKTLDELMLAVQKQIRNADGNPARLSILLRCDRRCPSVHVNELFSRLNQINVKQVQTAIAD